MYNVLIQQWRDVGKNEGHVIEYHHGDLADCDISTYKDLEDQSPEKMGVPCVLKLSILIPAFLSPEIKIIK